MKSSHLKVQVSTIFAHIVSGFTHNGIGGNPAGVVLDADALSEAQMQKVAAQLGLSETAFVSNSTSDGFKLDFFTPVRRIAHCGHATVAAFAYMAEKGIVQEGMTSKETVDGSRAISIKGTMAYMEQLSPRYVAPSDWLKQGVTLDSVLDSVGLSTKDLDVTVSPILVNTGNSFIVIGVKEGTRLQQLEPNFDAIEAISNKLDLVGYYLFTTNTDATDKDATTRMFAPRYGIKEESATGMAAGPLACVLYDIVGIKKHTFQIEQGKFMAPPSPSLISVDLTTSNGKITGLMAGGKGKVQQDIEIEL